jgi:membrane protein required for colicin V production
MGVALDLLVLLVVLSSALRGLRRGLVYQVGQLALLVVAWFIAKGAAGPLGRPVASFVGGSPVLGSALAFGGVLLAVVLVGHVVLLSQIGKASGEDSAASQLNRVLGCLLGASRGLLVSYVVVLMLVQWSRGRGIEVPWEGSVSARFVSAHNILDGGAVGAFAKLSWLASTRPPVALATDPRLQRLMRRPDAQALLTPTFVGHLARRDMASLLGHGPLWDFLEQPEVQAELEAIPWVQTGDAASR